MTIRIDPLILTIRGYKDGVATCDALEDTSEDYKFVVTVSVIESHCYLSATHGELSIKDVREIKRELIKLGYKTASWRRARGKKVEVV